MENLIGLDIYSRKLVSLRGVISCPTKTSLCEYYLEYKLIQLKDSRICGYVFHLSDSNINTLDSQNALCLNNYKCLCCNHIYNLNFTKADKSMNSSSSSTEEF
jgi:hypothetical protein